MTPDIDGNLNLHTICRNEAEDNERKLVIHPKLKFFASMNRIAIEINNHELIIIKIRVRFEHSLSIRHENIFDPLNSKIISNSWDTSTRKCSDCDISLS